MARQVALDTLPSRLGSWRRGDEPIEQTSRAQQIQRRMVEEREQPDQYQRVDRLAGQARGLTHSLGDGRSNFGNVSGAMVREPLDVLLELKERKLEEARAEVAKAIARDEESRTRLGTAESLLLQELEQLATATEVMRMMAVTRSCTALELSRTADEHLEYRARVAAARDRVDAARRTAERDGAALRGATLHLAQSRAEQRAVSRVRERRHAQEARRREEQREEEAAEVASFTGRDGCPRVRNG